MFTELKKLILRTKDLEEKQKLKEMLELFKNNKYFYSLALQQLHKEEMKIC
jgi:hypothetical protein